MSKDERQPTRIALIYGQAKYRDFMLSRLRSVDFASKQDARSLSIESISSSDVVLVNVDDSIAECLEAIEDQLAQLNLPIIYNDARTMLDFSGWDFDRWERHFWAKVRGDGDVLPAISQSQTRSPVQAIWVLGASIGGPEALRRLLSHVNADLPLCFLLAQHMGAEFQAGLLAQLNQISDFRVVMVKDGMALTQGKVYMIPVDASVGIDRNYRLRLADRQARVLNNVSIDATIDALCHCAVPTRGAILLTGMSSDGVEAGVRLAQSGGSIWAQNAQSCVVSSISDGIRAKGVVEFSGTPKQLADRLNRQYANQQIGVNQKIRV